LLAATPYYLKGSGDPESMPMKRAREALKNLPASETASDWRNSGGLAVRA
jgi:hypothetical protein